MVEKIALAITQERFWQMGSRQGGRYGLWHLLLALGVVAGLFWQVNEAAAVVDIKRVKSPGGIEAWLVEDHSIPLIAMRFAFPGGAATDPDGKAGRANLVASLIDEGAGDLTSRDFQRKLSELAARLSYSAGKDWFSGRFQTLSRNRNESFNLLKLSLTRPRFDAEPVARIRNQIAVGIKRNDQNPQRRASRAWIKLMLGDHNYARPTQGRLGTLQAITTDDLKSFVAERLVRKGLKIAVVGDITPDELARRLDEIFGALPQQGAELKIPEAAPKRDGGLAFVQMNIPQTVIQFGLEGIKRHDKDFIPAFMMNYILGGGGFTSRLTREIRVKRGLTYSVYSYLRALDKAAFFVGGASTRADRAAETVKLIRAELAKMAEQGMTPAELTEAKTYLVGSYPLRFDTNSKIASQLLGIQMDRLGIDYVTKRNGLIEAVTISDIKRVAKRLLKPGALKFAIVGKVRPADMKEKKAAR